MRIAHIADLHLTSGRRFADTCSVLKWCVARGREEQVELWLVAGDLAGTTDVPHVASVEERNFLDELFQEMGTEGPVVVLAGNHDDPRDLAGYARLKAVHPIYVVDNLGLPIHVVNKRTVGGCVVHCIPYPHRRDLLATAGGEATAEHAEAADVLRQKLREWASPLLPMPGKHPSILCGHLTIRGSTIAGDEIMAGKEVELTPEDLDAFPADYIALGHIHRHQQVGQDAWYAGSPTAQSFGETDTKGFLIVDVERGLLPVVHRIETPARKLVTVDMRWVQDKGEWQWTKALEDCGYAGQEVRLRVELPEDAMGGCPIDGLEAQLAAMGAHSVTIERKVVPRVRMRSEAISTAHTPRQKLEAWWESQGTRAPATVDQERLCMKLAQAEQAIAEGWKAE